VKISGILKLKMSYGQLSVILSSYLLTKNHPFFFVYKVVLIIILPLRFRESQFNQMSHNQKTVTMLLKDAGNGDSASVNSLFDIVYDELQQMAHFYLRELSNSDTINTTALVHEAYLKMFNKEKLTLENRVHFFALCGKVMRQILVDYYRKKTAQKRGGSVLDQTLSEEIISGTEHRLELIDLDLALSKLEKLNSRLSVVVECKFFAAMNDDEIALYLGVTDRTVRNDWRKARMWLSRELSGPK